jgi:hypothetical protein
MGYAFNSAPLCAKLTENLLETLAQQRALHEIIDVDFLGKKAITGSGLKFYQNHRRLHHQQPLHGVAQGRA